MKPNIKQLEKWIAALRSGEYKQDYQTLQSSQGYCCLGVACKIFIKKPRLVTCYTKTEKIKVLFGGIPMSQPQAPKWLKDINHDFEERTGRTLTRINDSKRFNFDEIADLLELVYIHKILD